LTSLVRAGHRDPDRSLYWRSRRDLLLDLDRGRSTGARVLRWYSMAQVG